MKTTDVKWCIEKDFFWEFQPDTILKALEKLGIEYHFLKLNCNSTPFNEKDCVIVHGSIEFARKLNRSAPWTPGASWICERPKSLYCSQYYSYFGEHLLNQECCFLPLSELIRKKDFYFKLFGKDNRLFVRPDSPYKEFTGHVFDKDKLEGQLKGLSYGELSPTLMTLVAKPKKILAEYRFYVCKDEVVTGSRYMLNGEHDEEKGYSGNALRLAREISEVGWRPSPIFVVDIGETEDGECKLLEINSFNCSGMYLCDLEKIVKKANEKALADWEGVYIDI